jgi:hypothetical protein
VSPVTQERRLAIAILDLQDHRRIAVRRTLGWAWIRR